MARPLYVFQWHFAPTHLLTHFAAIHGDKQQNERDWVLNEFKTGKSPIMVATDVASRGIGMKATNPTPLSLLPPYSYSVA